MSTKTHPFVVDVAERHDCLKQLLPARYSGGAKGVTDELRYTVK